MQAHKAHVKNGQIIFDEPAELPEGAELYIVVNDGGDELDDEERAELNAMLEESFEEMRQGKTVDGEAFLAELRSRLCSCASRRARSEKSIASMRGGGRIAWRHRAFSSRN